MEEIWSRQKDRISAMDLFMVEKKTLTFRANVIFCNKSGTEVVGIHVGGMVFYL
jgi:hypothetical protein